MADSARYSRALGSLVVVLGLVMAGSACDGSDPDPQTASNEVQVSENLTPVASYPDQEAAAAKASDLASFEVQPIHDLPDRFTVDAFDVHQAVGGNFTLGVLTFIQGDPAGLLITQSGDRSDPDPSWDELVGPGPGSYYRNDLVDGGASFHLHTTDRTYSLVTHTDGGITDDEAVRILSGFLNNP